MQWQLKHQPIVKTKAELKNVLLANRQLSADDDFFKPQQPQKFSLKEVGLVAKQLEAAVKRLLEAIDHQEKIIIFGDYDADGVCATAILWQTLDQLGADVMPFIPEREKHGYGLSLAALDDLLSADKPDLVVTVDNGIVAHQPAQRVKEADIDLIITDHHQPEEKLPPATAIVQTDQLCGATVSWFLARELMRAKNQAMRPNWQLDLAAIATVADQVPLREANRSFVYYGLQALAKTKRLGLQILLKKAGIRTDQLNTGSIGFGLAPRINAMGRLEQSLDALRLLLTTDEQRAQRLAQTLEETNAARKDLTYNLYGQALEQAKKWKKEKIIIVAAEAYHEGVIGLVAGRLVSHFSKPAIVISLDGEVAKASARSVPGVNIVELIRQVRTDLLEVGGHPMAAGFALKSAKLELVSTKLKEMAQAQIDSALLTPSIEIDAQIPLSLVKTDTIEMVEQFAPFGQGNPRPILAIDQVEIMKILTLGEDDKHLKILAIAQDTVEPIDLLFWRKGELAEQLVPQQKIKIAGQLELNEWNGRISPQLKLIALETD